MDKVVNNTDDNDPDNFIADSDPTTTTDPLNPDTDGDSIPDGTEDHDTNGKYYNKDGWATNNETDPNLADTDGDGMPDNWEQNHANIWLNSDELVQFNPTMAKSDDDPDGDTMEMRSIYIQSRPEEVPEVEWVSWMAEDPSKYWTIANLLIIVLGGLGAFFGLKALSKEQHISINVLGGIDLGVGLATVYLAIHDLREVGVI